MDKKINKNKKFFIGEHVFCLKDFGNLKIYHQLLNKQACTGNSTYVNLICHVKKYIRLKPNQYGTYLDIPLI